MKKRMRILAVLLSMTMLVPAVELQAQVVERKVSEQSEAKEVIETTRAMNPYLPLWEHIPDGEPRVFEDPDNPGKYRVYVYGSHDNQKNSTYCGYDHVVWSAPVENLGNWRYEGVSYDCGGLLYAPDVVEKDGKYYLYTYDLSHGNSVSVSDRPAGPFKNMGSGGGHLKSGIGADPAILVDDDGKMYAYWGYQTYYQAEIDPATMCVKPGTTTKNAISNCNQEGEFQFYEGTSIRKVDGKYVMVYCQKPDKDPENGIIHDNYRARLAYAYSDNPLGPWTYGGPIIDNGGELLTNGKTSYPDGNVHGGIIEVGDQWYVFYHRMTNQSEFSRQAMMEPLEVDVEQKAGGKVTIKQAEMTSQGADQDGLDAYQHYDAGIACYLTEGAYITTDYSQTSGYNPVAGLKNGSVVGYKYMDFGKGAGEDEFLQLALDMKCKGTAGKIDIFIDDPNNGTRKTDGTGTKIGSIELGAGGTDYYVEKTTVENVTGKHALFFVFSSEEGNGEICEINGFEFVKNKTLFQDDFSDGLEKWTVTGHAKTNEGRAVLGENDQIAAKDGMAWSNYMAEWIVAEGNGVFDFYKSDENNYYTAELNGNAVRLSVTEDGKKRPLKTVNFQRTEGKAIKFAVTCADGQIVVRINGAPVMIMKDDTHQGGTVAVTANGSLILDSVMMFASEADPELRIERIYLNGQPLAGFNSNQEKYQVALKDDEELPVVSAESTDENTRIGIVQASEVPGAAVVKFITEKGTRTYVIEFYREESTYYDFTKGALPEGWSIVNPKDANNNVTFSEEGVTVSTDGADLPGTANQLQLDKPLTGNYQVDTHVKIDKPLHQNWAKYGLTIYKDDKNMIIMDHEHDSKAKVQILWWKDGNWMTNGVSKPDNTQEIYFRLKKEGNNFECLYSTDGKTYTSVYTAETDGRFEENALLHLFFSKQNVNNETFCGTVDYVNVTNLAQTPKLPELAEDLEQLSLNIGKSVEIPYGAYADSAAIAAKAAEMLAERDDVKAADADVKVEVQDSHFVLTLSRGQALCVTEPFEIVVAKADGVPVDAEHFPDAVLRKYVMGFAGDDGVLSQAELDAVTKFYTPAGTLDMTGIEYFTKLTYLHCGLGKYKGTKLDISKNTELESLYCQDVGLTSLDISNNPKLVTVNCSGNQLTSLDASNHPNLKYLYVGKNKLLDIKGIEGRELMTVNASNNSSRQQTVVIKTNKDSFDMRDIMHDFDPAKICSDGVRKATLDGTVFKDFEYGEEIYYDYVVTKQSYKNDHKGCLQIRLLVEPEEGYYAVKVDGKTKVYAYNDEVTVTAPQAENGYRFAGWKVGNEIVSYKETYKFYASRNMELVPTYEKDTVAVVEKASAILTNTIVTKRADEKSDVRFVGELTLPEGYKVLEAGLVWSSKDDTELVTEDGQLGSGLKPTYISKISDTNQFSVTIKGMPADRFLRGVIFAKVVDEDGKEMYIFSGEKILYAVE